MKTKKYLSARNIFNGIVGLFMISSMATVNAEQATSVQISSHERADKQLNSPAVNSNSSQSQNREEYTTIKLKQQQYKYMNEYPNKESSTASSSMYRMNTMNHYMQGGVTADSMNQQNTTHRFIRGGVIKVF